ncbi:helix-turn-helix domain-containing protein [Clostridium sp. MCC353]|uniref:response regulator transcription factor n=1 Tax=Clostridium sp. MCC353 TaxID=2592646 RepID=UPI001C011496|nr:helix-turn-helix domain-containing protein [Clostridium sp. MCC353]MBT9778733.1 helix-turn-helix domain-containing protein [Clostridium sp. MCC353]
MTLLVVDDQREVVGSILHSVDWVKMGFTLTLAAFSAKQAKELLNRYQVDIILCDVEMPDEDGLSLLQWTRKMEHPPAFLILSSHAEFDYAKRALQMGAQNYILQPASSVELENAVQKVIDDLKLRHDADRYKNIGKYFDRHKVNLVSNFLTYIIRNDDIRSKELIVGNHAELVNSGYFPDDRKQCWLGIIQVIRWTSSEPWEPGLLWSSMSNVIGEILEGYQYSFLMSQIETYQFAIMVWNQGEESCDPESIQRQLSLFLQVCRDYLGCDAAVYAKQAENWKNISRIYRQLEGLKQDNVVMASGIFMEEIVSKRQKAAISGFQWERWARQLSEGYGQQVENEFCSLLDGLVAKGGLNAEQLKYIYADFLHLIYQADTKSRDMVKLLLNTKDGYNNYINGMKSIETMKKLAHSMIALFDHKEPELNAVDVVSQVEKYVKSHQDEEIHRHQIAEYVHLSPDYLNRIFKKETGYSLKEYIIRHKMEAARYLLTTTNLPIGIIAAKVGYYNFSHFSQTYKKVFDELPRTIRKR